MSKGERQEGCVGSLDFHISYIIPPPTPSITSHPPFHSHPPSQTNPACALSSSATTLSFATVQFVRDDLKARYLARASRETLGGVYIGDILASHCYATLLA